MDEQELLAKLESLAEELDYEIRYEAAGGRSGKCILHGQKVAVIDSRQTVEERVNALAAILADEDLNGVYLPPVLRLLVESYRTADDAGEGAEGDEAG